MRFILMLTVALLLGFAVVADAKSGYDEPGELGKTQTAEKGKTSLEERVAKIEGILEEIRTRLNHLEERFIALEGRINSLFTMMIVMWATIIGTIIGMWVTVVLTILKRGSKKGN